MASDRHPVGLASSLSSPVDSEHSNSHPLVKVRQRRRPLCRLMCGGSSPTKTDSGDSAGAAGWAHAALELPRSR
ncbi:hypothetical protein NDU88_008678 [Pleurodeles waltl]|uniref:Uncharacterized protein n=1 Tax=Pleurodeles waltl TaxID=8319 RepID=A0AAV7RYB4_PLEWA|nr:hypothetical protein NDU88_008678 [Pleurodeles waltl]